MNKRLTCTHKIMRLGKMLFIVGAALLSSLSLSAELERLFSTPSERLYLNQLRSSGKVAAMLPGSETNKGIEQPANAPVKFNGVVKRSSGRSDAWINGQHAGSDQMLTQKLDYLNRMRVQVPDSNRIVRMKPGQVMDPVTGRVSDVYEMEKSTQTPLQPQAEVEPQRK